MLIDYYILYNDYYILYKMIDYSKIHLIFKITIKKFHHNIRTFSIILKREIEQCEVDIFLIIKSFL